jgi:hypothetical protein
MLPWDAPIATPTTTVRRNDKLPPGKQEKQGHYDMIARPERARMVLRELVLLITLTNVTLCIYRSKLSLSFKFVPLYAETNKEMK